MSAKHAVILGVTCLLFSIVYYQFRLKDSSNQLDIEEITAAGFRKAIGERPFSYRKIAVGTNANIDLIVSGVDLLQELGVSASTQRVDCSAIDTLEVLEQCFSHFMAKGAAAERPITSAELSSLVVTASGKLSKVQHFVGGNAALVGLKFADLVPNGKVMLCGPVGPKLKSLLPEGILVPEKCQMPEDENHLILEYGKNEKWGEIEAPVANRFIMSHDEANSAMSTLESFIGETLKFGPDLVVVSGFHLLDGNNDVFWRKRIADAASAFVRLPTTVPVHLELASMTSCAVIKAIVEKIFPLVNSVGLNEQELVFISKCLGEMQQDLTALDKSNEIGFYSDLMNWILEEYGENGKRFQGSRLSRIHFHCLYVHILAVKPDHWTSNEASVSAGAWTAYSQACETDVANSDMAELTIAREFSESLSSPKMITYNASDPISTVSRGSINVFISPALVCRRPLKTVGLGDAISASGLLYSSFVP